MISTKSQHADELHQLNEMQRGYIVRIQELQVENKSLHARNRYLAEAKDAEARKRELELERDKQRDAAMIAGLEEQVKALQERLEAGGLPLTTTSKAGTSAASASHRSSIAPPALPDTLEDRMSELQRRSSALSSQSLSRQLPMELKRQSSALSQKLARQALTDSIVARETAMTLDDLIGNRSGSDVAALTMETDGAGEPDRGFRRDDAPQRAAESTLTLDQLLGAFDFERE